MKFVHVTDLHLGPRQVLRFGVSQIERLTAAIAHINAAHADAALCVVTGDLADSGDRSAYEDLRAGLDRLTVPYLLLLGNHDRRGPFLSVFPETELTPGGFVQSVRDYADVRVVCLDTLAEGRTDGVLDDLRLEWLDRQLAAGAGKQVLIFMHHPPLAIGIPMLDPLALSDPGPFLRLVARSGGNPHLFFGHVHRPVHGTVSGVPFTAQRGIAVQFALDLNTRRSEAEAAPPSCGVILVADGRVVVHEEAFATGWARYDLDTGRRLDATAHERLPLATSSGA
jgi:3',5'-cyclic AMP phosphodiesterase CpdA